VAGLARERVSEVVDAFNERFPWKHLFYLSYEPATSELSVLTLRGEVPVSYSYLELHGIRYVVCHLSAADLLCSETGRMLVQPRGELVGLVEHVAPLLKASGFTRDALAVYYVIRGEGALRHVVLDDATLDALSLPDVLPSETVVADNGGGALSHRDYELACELASRGLLEDEFIPYLAKLVLARVYGAEPSPWRGRTARLAPKASFTVRVGGDEYLVLYASLSGPIREYNLEHGLLNLTRTLRRLRLPRGVLLLLYLERVVVSGARALTPRFFWFLISYDRERGSMAVPGAV